VTVTPQVTPSFDAIPAVCSGATITLPPHLRKALPHLESRHQQHGYHHLYLYANRKYLCHHGTLTVTVTPQVTPSFDAIPAVCSGATITLPATLRKHCRHLSPAINNTATTTYTFTPTGNTCATTATLTVTVTPQVTPSLMRYLRYVAVATITLPATSKEALPAPGVPPSTTRLPPPIPLRQQEIPVPPRPR
jgi:hypothetical protein